MNKELKSILESIEKKFGKEAIMLLGQKNSLDVETFPSGSIVLDHLLGINGYPKGRIIEIFGPESSGKTTLSLHAIAEIQKLKGMAAFIDVEHAIDPSYAQRIGVNINDLILSQPDSGEQALEIVDTLVKTQVIDLIVIDSVAALVPEAELKGEMKDQTIGAQARLMSKALRKITSISAKSKTTIIFINQIRSKVGVMFGSPETTSGGRALKFYASIRLDVRRVSSIGQGQNIEGNVIKMKTVKNKLAAPFKIGLTEIIFSQGISLESEIIDLCLDYEIIAKKGSWYSYLNKNIAQGKMQFKDLLQKDEKLKKELLEKLKSKMKI